jgi:uncharacterized membrane protein YdjX (TVP38/TMEM64 family)
MTIDHNRTESERVHRSGTQRRRLGKTILFVVLLGLVSAAFVLRDRIPFERLALYEEQLQIWCDTHAAIVYATAALIYVVVTGLSLPGATLMSLVFAWLFGFWRGLVLVSLSSTVGATLAMVIGRYLFREFVRRRFASQFERVDREFEKEGVYYLFFLRLIPVFPFVLVNLLMGLTRIRVWTYCWVSWLGMLPATAVYVLAGSRFPDIRTLLEEGAAGVLKWDVLLAFALLGLSVIGIRLAVRARRSNSPG